MNLTLFDKVWSEHVIASMPGGADLIHIDRHLLHDLNGVGGYRELRKLGYRVRNPELTFATPDHAISSAPGRDTDPTATGMKFVTSLRNECAAAGIRLFDLGHEGQGIVHVIGPELALSLPGLTIVCGDGHTCTHGAMGALAFGIGSTELLHVLATQTIVQRKPRKMRVRFEGGLARGVHAEGPHSVFDRAYRRGGGFRRRTRVRRLDHSTTRTRRSDDHLQSIDRTGREDRNDRTR